MPKPEYIVIKKPTHQSRVIQFEMVVSPEEFNRADLEDVLDTMRQYGAASIVEDFLVDHTFDDAAKILANRTKEGSL